MNLCVHRVRKIFVGPVPVSLYILIRQRLSDVNGLFVVGVVKGHLEVWSWVVGSVEEHELLFQLLVRQWVELF